MAFWDRVSEELKKAAAEGWQAVKAGTKVAAEKSEEVAKTGKLRYKSHTVHKQADKLFGQLGGIVYDMAEPPFENPLLRADVQKIIEDIKRVEKEATALDEEVERVKKSASSDASDVPYYYEASRQEGSSTAEVEDGDKGGDDSNESEHACYSDCSGPCQCTDDTVVNSDLPEADSMVESHDYECPTDDEVADESYEKEDLCKEDPCEDKEEKGECEDSASECSEGEGAEEACQSKEDKEKGCDATEETADSECDGAEGAGDESTEGDNKEESKD